MTTVILLAAEDAALVRGPSATVEGAALAPVATADGRYALPLAVLDDPAHVAHRPLLASLSTADASTIAWPEEGV